MIRTHFEELFDNNGKYVRFHIYTEGKCGLETTKEPEWDNWVNMSKDELKRIASEILKFCSHYYTPTNMKEGWD